MSSTSNIIGEDGAKKILGIATTLKCSSGMISVGNKCCYPSTYITEVAREEEIRKQNAERSLIE